MADAVYANRSYWRGTVSFGLVSVPVKLYGATTARDVRFNQVHKGCGARVHTAERRCDAGHVVESGETGKAFQYDKGRYVEVDPDVDLEPLRNKAGKTMNIVSFVKPSAVDPVQFEKSYYVEPDKTGLKAFALLRQAMEAEKVWAVAKIVKNDKEHMAVLRPDGDRVLVHTLFWPDEVKVPAYEQLDEPEVGEDELKMARLLVKNLVEKELDPEQFKDEYREQLLAVLNAKAEGTAYDVGEAGPVAEPVDNEQLLATLKAAVKAAKKSKKEDAA